MVLHLFGLLAAVTASLLNATIRAFVQPSFHLSSSPPRTQTLSCPVKRQLKTTRIIFPACQTDEDSSVFARKIMKRFKLESGYAYASRTGESSEWRVKHYWGGGRRETLGTLREILDLL